MRLRLVRSRSSSSSEKVLNVIFNYNGHSWDAYEVLGLPAGAPWDQVHAAYQRSRNSSDQSAQAFLDHAVKAIQQHISQR